MLDRDKYILYWERRDRSLRESYEYRYAFYSNIVATIHQEDKLWLSKYYGVSRHSTLAKDVYFDLKSAFSGTDKKLIKLGYVFITKAQSKKV